MDLKAQGKCAGFSLSTNTESVYYEGTGAARQIPDTLEDTVKLSFAAVEDAALQGKLVELSAHPMPAFKATNLITAIQSQAMTKGGMNAAIVQKFSLSDSAGFYRNMLAVGSGVAFTTDGASIAPTAYIPTGNPALSRMLLHAPCNAEETRLLGMLYGSRRAMNASMSELEASAKMYGVTKPQMAFRGEQLVTHQRGVLSTVVVKCGCYPPDATRTWAKENAARRAVALANGMCSFRNLSSEVWMCSYVTNPTVAAQTVAAQTVIIGG